ncbi:hypothetical protein UFOVP1299_54 [uncultured Caudovirales phage]|uniref:Uncharacterized protein n=1 Tax=uncultured Caudovirales phage TaxID=2100421 RepID=A0A6J5RR22_9CAUD|nr:hypothetical protein UFOVP1299_54 [uncultured Caudovirales phage]
MNIPGVYSLGDVAITTAVTGLLPTEGVSASGVAQTFISGLEGVFAVSLQARLAYGSGGTTCKAYVQTSFDQGTTWVDVACFAFGTASETALVNLSCLTPKTTQVVPTDGTLADDTSVDGLLGDRIRAKVTTTGTYATNTVLSLRMVAR